MPRLTDTHYLDQRNKLLANWFDPNGNTFGRISSRQQLELHDYFAVTAQLIEADVLAHRLVISREKPSLSQRAGRAYRQIEPFLEHPIQQLVPAPTRGGHVVAHTVRRPHLDTGELSRIITKMIAADAKNRPKD
jgi:hypothetical protein